MLTPSTSNFSISPSAPYLVAHMPIILLAKSSALSAFSFSASVFCSTAFVSCSIACFFCSMADLSLPITTPTCSALSPASFKVCSNSSLFSIKPSPKAESSLSPSMSFCTHTSKASSSERFSVSVCSFSSDAKNSLNSGTALTCSVASSSAWPKAPKLSAASSVPAPIALRNCSNCCIA